MNKTLTRIAIFLLLSINFGLAQDENDQKTVPNGVNIPENRLPELLRDLILNSTNENDAILDPFAGSGVTGQQSVKLNRKCGMIEVSQEAINNHIIPKLK